MTFQSHKCPNTQSDVIQHRAQSAALSAFDKALLFQRPMIHFDPPRRFGLRFPFSFGHFFKARRPIFRCAVCSTNPEYFDLSKTFEPYNCSVAAAQSSFRHGLQRAAADSDLPVRLEARQKMPAQRAAQFQVLNRPVPTARNTPAAD